ILLLLVVPAYYLAVQSALHTEYRYVLAIHYFLFILVAVALHAAGSYLCRGVSGTGLFRRLMSGARLRTSGT
ncbi:MAG TPA: hypothetical protein VJT09_09280, partial [Pyrinomonadaceae bacterium]|nr:hypothetical protein [Pyrinomonadaceae bacterium]